MHEEPENIDSVAVNTFGKKILFAEVKPQKSGINLTALQLKSAFFLQRNKAYKDYELHYQGFSAEDL